MKILNLITVYFVICICSVTAESGTCKYLSKYKFGKADTEVTCYYDKESNEYIQKHNDQIILKNKYNSINDFINERNEFGRTYCVSSFVNINNFTNGTILSYDNSKIIEEKSLYSNIKYSKWDSKNRPISGKCTINNSSTEFLFHIQYDEINKIIKCNRGYPTLTPGKDDSFIVSSILIYDDYNNIIKSINIQFNDESKEIIKKDMEYQQLN